MAARIALLALVGSHAAALRLDAPRKTAHPNRVTLATPSLAAAVTSLPSCALATDLWVELNKPPINLNPFEINPVGWIFFAMYGSYLAWSIARPPSEAEKAYAEKMEREAVAAGALAADFIAQAAAEEGARVLPSGLVYCETVSGAGSPPGLESKVLVHYEGKLANGNVFDSSLARGEPAEFKVGQVIKGWQEGLQLMKPGGKAVLTIPAELAYGPMAVGSIPGNSALQFQVELIEVKEGGGFFGFGS
ncbi:hypothetical protein AB1Y20_005190 [Prymnesium parvum]|uniref:peptidylprolyl isomerase n=1 Tax=Prymnesium parvum TaxID=97485 RepID=A0AB34J3K9_PRYPA|mmetsp:Transcript_36496/g.64169  ORF Transcript_36496/g.64169 Transcript_36496/m.64169 type:complete len:248 (-) Transcript_36496:438-1181(-)